MLHLALQTCCGVFVLFDAFETNSLPGHRPRVDDEMSSTDLDYTATRQNTTEPETVDGVGTAAKFNRPRCRPNSLPTCCAMHLLCAVQY
eukprot:1566873-Rhodomonas_salina.2